MSLRDKTPQWDILFRVKVLDALRLRRGQADIQASMTGGVVDPSTFPIASPWSSSTLERIVAEDVFGSQLPTNTRGAAMRIPAVARGRNLLVSTICRFPLAGATAAGALDRNPAWMTATDDGTTPQHRMAWTVDDLVFYGWSCWWRRNGADGFPLAFSRINQGDWSLNADNEVELHGNVVPPDVNGRPQIMLISGLHEGLLSFGRDTIADAATLYRIVRDRLASPLPALELHQTGGETLNKEERDEVIDSWVAARAAGKAVGYTSENMQVNVLESGQEQLMIEARNAASLDLARMIGVTAGLLDATAPKASLNYETTTGRNQEFVDRDLALYMTPITARLSLDDVMPHGQHATFDVADFTAPTPAPTGPILED